MTTLTRLQDALKSVRLGEAAKNLPSLLEKAETSDDTYASFLTDVVSYEQKRREEKKIERHFKWATFPFHKTLNQFDVSEQQSLSKKQFNQLRELLCADHWCYHYMDLSTPVIMEMY